MRMEGTMKFKNMIHFAGESVSRNIKQFFLLLILGIFGFSVLSIVILMMFLMNKGTIELNESLNHKLDRTGSIIISGDVLEKQEEISSFWRDLKELNSIETVFHYEGDLVFEATNFPELKVKEEVETEKEEDDFISGLMGSSGIRAYDTSLDGMRAMGMELKKVLCYNLLVTPLPNKL